MSIFLLRSVLQEIAADLPGAGAGEPTGELTMSYLIVVARNESALYEHLRSRHGSDPRVRVMIDRRSAKNAATTEGPRPVERRRRRSWLATGASHELVELARQYATESPSPKQQPSSHSEEAPRQMSETETVEDQQRVGRWLVEGQDILGCCFGLGDSVVYW